MTDQYDDLTGDDLSAEFEDAGGPTEGGSNADGTYSADEKRAYLREHATPVEDGGDGDGADELDTSGLNDSQVAEALSGPVPRLYRDELTRAHAANDTEAIASLTRDINEHRIQAYRDAQKNAA